jgi:NDP-mannose synthase
MSLGNSRRAIVLAGGKGTRLLPYTIVIPKPMLPIGEIPIIEIISRQLKFYNFDHVTISLGYHGEMIRLFLIEKKADPGLPEFDFFIESSPLGTSGPVKSISPKSEDFLVINGDILSTIDLNQLFLSHCESKAALTIAVRKTSYQLPLGSIEVDNQNNVLNFKEKPTFEFLDNIGAYVYNSRVLNYMSPSEQIDVNVLTQRLIENKESVRVFRSDGPYFWIDIGTHADYERANKEFAEVSNSMPFLKGI